MKTPRVAAALALAGAALTLGACKSGDSPKASEPSARAPAESTDESSAEKPETPSSTDDIAGVPSMDELRKDRSIREEKRATLVQHFVQLGDEAFAASRFDDAKNNYGDALDLDSTNEHSRRRMQQIGAGERVEMTVIRDGERKNLTVKLGQRPGRRR
jgi:hypothetical protein